MPYPVTITVEPPQGARNRLTTAFRIILVIPHFLLVGGIGTSLIARREWGFTTEGGLLGAVVGFLAIVSWITIVFAGIHIAGIREFSRFFLRWRVRSTAYAMLLEDRYPPFGDAPYPAAVDVIDAPVPRDRVSVGFRLLLAIPHFVALFFISIAWTVTAFIAWVLILVTGEYPRPLYDFGVSVLRWHIRVEAYLLLLVDAYPPFAFD